MSHPTQNYYRSLSRDEVDCCPMFFFLHVPSYLPLSLLSSPLFSDVLCVLLSFRQLWCGCGCRVVVVSLLRVVVALVMVVVCAVCVVCIVAGSKPSLVHSKRYMSKTSPCVPVRTCLKHVLVVTTCGRGGGTHGYFCNVHTGTCSMHTSFPSPTQQRTTSNAHTTRT